MAAFTSSSLFSPSFSFSSQITFKNNPHSFSLLSLPNPKSRFRIRTIRAAGAELPNNSARIDGGGGENGFVLEDVPHLTHHLPDLPVYPSPIRSSPAYAIVKQNFVGPEDVVAQRIVVQKNTPRGVHFRRAGPREMVYFQSDEVCACIVTCGGLCPGINTVIREVVCGLNSMYGVDNIIGIEGGYRGFYSKNTVQLTPKTVNDIHKRGGTILRTSRGGHDTNKIVDSIQYRGINQVYIIGGDGTQKGAAAIYQEVEKRGLQVAVAGIPKTIDNDISKWVYQEKNDPEFAKKLASLADLYMNDEFGTAHQAHASTEGVTKFLRPSVAGFLLRKELDYLVGVVSSPKRPFAAIVGGSKVSSKIGVIESLLEKCDILLLGGGMIFTFYKAQGLLVGSSLVEEDKQELATSLLAKVKAKGVSLLRPTDVIIADKFAPDANSQVVPSSAIPDGWKWMKSPPQSKKHLAKVKNGERTRGRKHAQSTLKEKLLKVMTVPLTTPCAHNFCKLCLLEAYADQPFIRERTRGGCTLKAQDVVKKCLSCPNNISDFLHNPQINLDLMEVIKSLQKKIEEYAGEEELDMVENSIIEEYAGEAEMDIVENSIIKEDGSEGETKVYHLKMSELVLKRHTELEEIYKDVHMDIESGVGRAANAAEVYQHAVVIIERKKGADSEELVMPLFSLGDLFITEGKAADAEACFSRILSIYSKNYEENDGRVGMAMCSLAHALCAKGRAEEAICMYRNGLGVIKDSKHVTLDNDVLEKMKVNLAELFHISGREQEGRELLQECLLITERHRGIEHPNLVSHLINLAASHSRSKNFVKSEHLLRTCLQIMSRTVNPDDQSITVPMLHLAVALYHLKKKMRKLRNLQQVSKLYEDMYIRGVLPEGCFRGTVDSTELGANTNAMLAVSVATCKAGVAQKRLPCIWWEVYKNGIRMSIQLHVQGKVIDKSFGFDTAVEEAQRAINAAHVEVESVDNGVGIVKLMGRYSGFIAMHATLASRDVDCCLIPESPFYLEGRGGLYEFIEQRLKENGHMVIVVAEGAGQEYVARNVSVIDGKDESGNRLLLDIGLWLSQKIKDHFTRDRKLPVYLKYIDPTYMIRAIPSNASDNVYCTLLAHSAVHGAMAGYTGFTVGPVNGKHAYIPIHRVTEKTNVVKITDRMWARLLASTNQPSFLDNYEVQEMVDKDTLDLIDRMRINSL